MASRFLNKRKFNRETKRFFDNGFMKRIYENREFVLCNYANQCYLLFPHRFCDYGIIISKNNLVTCIENYMELITFFVNLPEEKFLENTVVIDDKLFEHARKTKLHTDANGPSEFVDLEVEKEIAKAFDRA